MTFDLFLAAVDILYNADGGCETNERRTLRVLRRSPVYIVCSDGGGLCA